VEWNPTSCRQQHHQHSVATHAPALMRVCTKKNGGSCDPPHSTSAHIDEMALGFALSPVQLLLQFVVVNMLNYVDRGVVAGVLPTLQTEFGLDSTQTGFLGSSFVISYMIFSLPFAQLAQRFSPFMLMGVGLAFWIGSALVAYFSVSYQMLLVARSQPNARYFFR
jgi:sugar phosphate permease